MLHYSSSQFMVSNAMTTHKLGTAQLKRYNLKKNYEYITHEYKYQYEYFTHEYKYKYKY